MPDSQIYADSLSEIKSLSCFRCAFYGRGNITVKLQISRKTCNLGKQLFGLPAVVSNPMFIY